MVVGTGINPKISLMLSQRSTSDLRPLGSTVPIFKMYVYRSAKLYKRNLLLIIVAISSYKLFSFEYI